MFTPLIFQRQVFDGGSKHNISHPALDSRMTAQLLSGFDATDEDAEHIQYGVPHVSKLGLRTKSDSGSNFRWNNSLLLKTSWGLKNFKMTP